MNRGRRRRALPRIVACAGLTVCVQACTTSHKSETPVLEPEPVVELSDAHIKSPSLAPGSFDRAHWQARAVAPLGGGVLHHSVVVGAWADSAQRAPFPTAENVLASSADPATDPGAWLVAQIEPIWQVIRLPLALFLDDLPGVARSSPRGLYDRAPTEASDARGVRLDPADAP